MNNEQIFSQRLVLSSRIAIESVNDKEVVIFHTSRSTRLKLTKSLYQLIRNFNSPTYLQDLVSDNIDEKLEACILSLKEKGFLLTEQECDKDSIPQSTRNLSTTTHTLFNSPRYQAGKPAANAAIVGIPFDLGNVEAPGARKGPAQIRICSHNYDYHLDFLTGEPIGWFDIEKEERILAGKTIADWGDIWFQHGESIDTIFQRIANVCEEIVSNNSLPVFIGGDHSVTFPIVEQLQKLQPLVLIWFDAHNDYGEILPGAANNHKNVARRIMQLPNIIKLIQIGYRGYTVHEDINPLSTRRKIVTTTKLRDKGISAILAEIPPHLPCYISIDIDVLDPIYAPATSTPVPNGLSVKELKDAICAVGANSKIVGFDLMEVNPEKDIGEVTSLVACHLLLTTLSTALDRKTE